MDRVMMKVGNEALAFYKVGKKAYNDNIKKINNNPEEAVYGLIVAIVNLAFSIELCLKTFIDETESKKCKHDLKKLFNMIDETYQKELIKAIIKQFSQFGSVIDEQTFWEYLDNNKNAFEHWRYYYQNNDNADVTFLYSMATVLKNFVSKIKEGLNRISN